jgi:hypothetical protein
MQNRNEAWYVAQRAELLAEQFVLDIHPSSVIKNKIPGPPFDFLAMFMRPDDSPVVIGVEVKATQHEISGAYPFPAKQAVRLLHSNIPILILVIDVKSNDIWFNWIRDAIPPDKQDKLADLHTCRLKLRKSSVEAVEHLRDEIIGDRTPAAA